MTTVKRFMNRIKENLFYLIIKYAKTHFKVEVNLLLFETGSLCLRTCYVRRDGLELLEIHRLLLSECQEYAIMSSNSQSEITQ